MNVNQELKFAALKQMGVERKNRKFGTFDRTRNTAFERPITRQR